MAWRLADVARLPATLLFHLSAASTLFPGAYSWKVTSSLVLHGVRMLRECIYGQCAHEQHARITLTLTLTLTHTITAYSVTVTVTVTEALVLRPLLEDRGRITESIRILVPVDRMKQNVFRLRRNKSVEP